MTALAEKNSSVVEYQIALAEIYINLAKAEDEQKDPGRAADHFDRAQTLLTPLLTDYATDARYCHNLIVALEQVARRHPDNARRAAATTTLDALHRRLLEILPRSSDAAAAKKQLDQIQAILAKLPPATEVNYEESAPFGKTVKLPAGPCRSHKGGVSSQYSTPGEPWFGQTTHAGLLGLLGRSHWLGIAASSRGQEPGTAGRLANPAGTAAADGQPQVPPAAPATGTQQTPPLDWLAGTPDMFGDFFRIGSQLQLRLPATNPAAGVLDLPLAGGSPRLSVAENNGTLPQDRVYFLYNHFQNALTDNTGGLLSGPLQQAFCIDRYTLGFEKTFLDRTWSVELRMPLAGTGDYSTTDAEVTGGNVGNLAIVLKRLVYESDNSAATIGLGIDTPTGSDVHGHLLATDFAVHNQALCLVPYIAFLEKPGEITSARGSSALTCLPTATGLHTTTRSMAGARSVRSMRRRCCNSTWRQAGGSTATPMPAYSPDWHPSWNSTTQRPFRMRTTSAARSPPAPCNGNSATWPTGPTSWISPLASMANSPATRFAVWDWRFPC